MSDKKSNFWYYTRRERQATLALLLVAIIVFLLPAVHKFRPLKAPVADTQSFLQAIDQLEAMQEKEPSSQVAAAFYFDPNTADREVLEDLGLSPATAQTIINYRKKVGHFQQTTDLQKIYNLSDEDYQRLAPYIKIVAKAEKPSSASGKKAAAPPEYFLFDPNTATRQELIRLGLSPKTAGTLIRYREKRGSFRKKEDLKRVYGVQEADYQRLEDYISISSRELVEAQEVPEAGQERSEKAIPASYKVASPILIDINQSTAEDWQQLYGIGPVLSERIVKFRDKLGGFIQIDQVAETFGLPDSTFQLIRPQLTFSPVIKRIAINRADARALQSHPYIQWQQANVIVAYRQEHGPYGSLEDLGKVIALKEAFIQRIAPYIQFD